MCAEYLSARRSLGSPGQCGHHLARLSEKLQAVDSSPYLHGREREMCLWLGVHTLMYVHTCRRWTNQSGWCEWLWCSVRRSSSVCGNEGCRKEMVSSVHVTLGGSSWHQSCVRKGSGLSLKCCRKFKMIDFGSCRVNKTCLWKTYVFRYTQRKKKKVPSLILLNYCAILHSSQDPLRRWM